MRAGEEPSAILPGAAAGGAVVALAFVDGGYFPTAWGWAALIPLLAAAAALALREGVPAGRLDALWLAGLLAYAAWTGLSALWAPAVETPLLELERTLVYVAVVLALLLVAGRVAVPGLVAGTLAGVVVVASWALATRLAPDRVGVFDSAAGYQLAEPLGYWNALGLLAALGILLALGGAAAASRAWVRAAAAAPLPLLACTLLFTYGRGAWVALAAGLAVLAALHPARARLAGLALVLAPAPAFAVWLCSRPASLNAPGATLADAARDGHRLAAVLVAVTAVEAGLAAVSVRLGPRIDVARRTQRALAAAAALAALAVAAVQVGSPLTALDRAADAFTEDVPATEGDLGNRLFSASGNGRSEYWRIALDQASDDPLLGGGAGSYQRRWLRDRPTAFAARDAHSLYLETLAELGPPGLAVLLLALGVPLAALARARGEPLAVAAGAAYAAFLVHAALDWDWEIPAVTVPALVLAAVPVLVVRSEPAQLHPGLRLGALAGVALAVAFAFVMHAGNTAVAASEAALGRGEVERAAQEARSARRWLPWAVEPRQRLAEAQVAARDWKAARATYRDALERDPGDWELWYGLALATNGAERERALNAALELNPRSDEANALRSP